jgi:hypothetical protein
VAGQALLIYTLARLLEVAAAALVAGDDWPG